MLGYLQEMPYALSVISWSAQCLHGPLCFNSDLHGCNWWTGFWHFWLASLFSYIKIPQSWPDSSRSDIWFPGLLTKSLLPDHADLEPTILSKAWFLRLVWPVGLSWVFGPVVHLSLHPQSQCGCFSCTPSIVSLAPTQRPPCLILSLLALSWDLVACSCWQWFRDKREGEDREVRELLERPASAGREYAETERTGGSTSGGPHPRTHSWRAHT